MQNMSPNDHHTPSCVRPSFLRPFRPFSPRRLAPKRKKSPKPPKAACRRPRESRLFLASLDPTDRVEARPPQGRRIRQGGFLGGGLGRGANNMRLRAMGNGQLMLRFPPSCLLGFMHRPTLPEPPKRSLMWLWLQQPEFQNEWNLGKWNMDQNLRFAPPIVSFSATPIWGGPPSCAPGRRTPPRCQGSSADLATGPKETPDQAQALSTGDTGCTSALLGHPFESIRRKKNSIVADQLHGMLYGNPSLPLAAARVKAGSPNVSGCIPPVASWQGGGERTNCFKGDPVKVWRPCKLRGA